MKHRIISALTAAVTLCSLSQTLPYSFFKSRDVAAADAAAPLAGDIDSDAVVSLADLALLKNGVHNTAAFDSTQYTAADSNSDGTVNIADVFTIKKSMLSYNYYMSLVINEVCSSNKDSFNDASGASPDWIEIYNPNDVALDLAGIGVSDGAKNKYKLAFPENTIIPADGYIIVCCDDAASSAEGEYHAAFKISATGETIYLTHPQFGEIDSVEVPELDTDVAYGRYANGSETFTYITTTPGADNNNAEDLRLVEKPFFSVEGGFYDAQFNLELTDTNGNEIYYTLDGSDPTTSSTAKLYTSSISIYNNTNDANKYSALDDITLYDYSAPSNKVDKGIVVRAVCKTADGRYSKVATNNYFIGKTASYYSDFKVISLSTDPDNFFSDDNGIYMVGSGYYQWKNSSEYVAYDDGDTLNPTNYNKTGKESEVPVNVQVFENGKLEYTGDVGARIAGNWSRVNPQKSIRLYARSEYGDSKMKYEFIDGLTDEYGNVIDEYDKITLRNGGNDNQYTHFRDALIHQLCEGTSVALQGTEPCIVFIDGEFWGFYFIRERLESDYVESHYGVDKDNVTVIKNGLLDEGSADVAQEYDDFLNWASSADMSNDANYQKVCDTIDIDSFMDYIAIETYINNADWATDYMNNWMMWRANTTDASNAYADGKWRFMLFDTEFSSGLYNNGGTISGYDSINNLYTIPGEYNFVPLFYNLLNNSEFAEKFYDNYIEIMKEHFAPSDVVALIDEYVSLYEEATRATNTRFNAQWCNENYASEITILKEFFILRRNNAKLYLDNLYNIGPQMTAGSNIAGSVSNWSYYGSGSASKSSSNNSFTMTTYSTCTNSWDIQSQTPAFTVKEGKSYRVSFQASCTTGAPIDICINHNVNNSWPNAFAKNGISLTSDLKTYTYEFISSSDTASDWRLCINYGNGAGVYVIKNLTVTELSYNLELVNEVGIWDLYNPTGEGSMTVNTTDAVTVETISLPDNNWEVQPHFYGMVFESGKTYTVKFTIRADASSTVRIATQENYGDYNTFLDKTISVSTSAQTYSYTFTMSQDCMDASLCFNCGYNETTYYITDVSVSCAR